MRSFPRETIVKSDDMPEVSSKTIINVSWALNGHKLYKLHIYPQNLHHGVAFPSLTYERRTLHSEH